MKWMLNKENWMNVLKQKYQDFDIVIDKQTALTWTKSAMPFQINQLNSWDYTLMNLSQAISTSNSIINKLKKYFAKSFNVTIICSQSYLLWSYAILLAI